jgi:ABC-type transport system involved in cytochrome bd biosynthesis fused ATPase/permease subunit
MVGVMTVVMIMVVMVQAMVVQNAVIMMVMMMVIMVVMIMVIMKVMVMRHAGMMTNDSGEFHDDKNYSYYPAIFTTKGPPFLS